MTMVMMDSLGRHFHPDLRNRGAHLKSEQNHIIVHPVCFVEALTTFIILCYCY